MTGKNLAEAFSEIARGDVTITLTVATPQTPPPSLIASASPYFARSQRTVPNAGQMTLLGIPVEPTGEKRAYASGYQDHHRYVFKPFQHIPDFVSFSLSGHQVPRTLCTLPGGESFAVMETVEEILALIEREKTKAKTYVAGVLQEAVHGGVAAALGGQGNLAAMFATIAGMGVTLPLNAVAPINLNGPPAQGARPLSFFTLYGVMIPNIGSLRCEEIPLVTTTQPGSDEVRFAYSDKPFPHLPDDFAFSDNDRNVPRTVITMPGGDRVYVTSTVNELVVRVRNALTDAVGVLNRTIQGAAAGALIHSL